jgi:ribonuclease HI/transposase InsO family protein
VEHLITKIL